MTVQDWMTASPITVGAGETAKSAHEIMRTNRIRHLPVISRGRLVGIVTDRDLRSTLAWGEPGTPHPFRVRELMTAKVMTVSPETRVERAARLMIEKKIGALPVLKRAALVGIITTTDLLRALVEGRGKTVASSVPSPLAGPSRMRSLEARRTPRAERGRRRAVPAKSARSARG